MKSEAPAVGHHFIHRLLAYIGPWFQNGGGSWKALVCDSVRLSGMDLYYTGLPDECYALETLFAFFFHVLWSFWQGHMRCVRLEWRTDRIECECSLFTPCSWLRRRNVKKKKKKKKVSGSLSCIVSSTSWLTRSRSMWAEDRIQNQEYRSQLLYSITRIRLWIAVNNLLQVSHLKIASNTVSFEVSIISRINWYLNRSTTLCCVITIIMDISIRRMIPSKI